MNKFYVVCCCLLIACNTTDKSLHTAKTDSIAKAVLDSTTPLRRCFAELSRDTVILSIQAAGTSVSGNLVYKLFEKDANKGVVSGTFHGDTLFATYQFESEGVTSTREVAFLVGDSTAKEGFGPVMELKGKMVFTHPGQLDFSSGPVLKKIACDGLPYR